jgi:hypothetical protein
MADGLDVGASTGGVADAFRKIGDGGNPAEMLGILSLIDDVDDVVHKSIQSDKGGQLSQVRPMRLQKSCALTAHRGCVSHYELIAADAQQLNDPLQIFIIEKLDLHTSFALTVFQADLRAEPFA